MTRLALAALLALAGTALADPPPPEVLAGLKSEEPNQRIKALMALSKLGVEVVPHVAPLLADDDEDVRQGAVVCLAVVKAEGPAMMAALKPFQADENPDVRKGTARVVQQWVLRKKATPKDALPLVEKAMKDELAVVRQTAVAALIKCGPDGLPILKESLGDSDVKVRAFSAAAVKAIDPPPPECFDLLVARLKAETEVPVKQTLLDALGVYGERAVPALVAALKEDAPSRLAALKTLAKLDKKGLAALKPSLPAVQEAVAAKEPSVRDAALALLAAFGADGQPAIAAALAAAKESDGRKAVLRVVGQMAQAKLPPTKEAVPAAAAALADEDAEVRALAAFVLGEAGPAAKEALPALEKAAADAGDYKPVFDKARRQIEGK